LGDVGDLRRGTSGIFPAARPVERPQRGFSFRPDDPIKLTLACTHAVTALAYLARQKPNAHLVSHAIARAEGIPEKFLLKLLRPLVSAGILRSVRGPNGGFALARDGKDVSLLEVIEAVDGPRRAVVTPVGKEGAAVDKRLQAVCDEAVASVRERLATVTLAELARER
jgi:Rrf2 family protein